MKIEGNTIIFKSTPENFHKEKIGLKPYTARRISLWSELKDFERFFHAWIDKDSYLQQEIKIINTVSGDDFTRKITDITNFDGLWIFAWNPGE